MFWNSNSITCICKQQEERGLSKINNRKLISNQSFKILCNKTLNIIVEVVLLVLGNKIKLHGAKLALKKRYKVNCFPTSSSIKGAAFVRPER